MVLTTGVFLGVMSVISIMRVMRVIDHGKVSSGMLNVTNVIVLLIL